MSKEQMIHEIRSHNPSARSDFLTGFGERELESYLRRLTQVQGHRGRRSIWVREGDTHSVVTRDAQ